MISRLFILDVYIHTMLHFATVTKGSRVRHMEKERKALDCRAFVAANERGSSG